MWQRCSSLDMDTIPSVLAHGAGLSSARVVEGSGPGPDASKQLAARDGDLSAVQNQCANQHSPVDVAFPLSLNISPPLIMLYCSTCKLVGYFSCPPCSL